MYVCKLALSLDETAFDYAGNVTSSIVYGQNFNSQYHEFDAAGRRWRWEGYGSWGDSTKKGGETTFDGDGRAAKKADLTMIKIQGNWGDWDEEYSYSLYSSVTGQKIVNLRSDGEDLFIYLGGTEIAKQRSEGDIHFKLTDPVSGRERITDPDGVMFVNEEDRIELAGLGTNVPVTNPQGGFPNADYESGGWAGDPENGCVDHMGDPMPCRLQELINDGSWGFSPEETIEVILTGINIPPPPRPDESPGQQPGSPNAVAFSYGGDRGDSGSNFSSFSMPSLPSIGGFTVNISSLGLDAELAGHTPYAFGHSRTTKRRQQGYQIPKPCADALRKIGLLNKTKKVLNGKIIDLDEIASEKASVYFGNVGTEGKTAGEFFDATVGADSALTYRAGRTAGTKQHPRGLPIGKTGTYRRKGDRGMSLGLRIHEAVHRVQPISEDLDAGLVKLLNVDATGKTESQALTDYFNNNCDPKYLKTEEKK